MKSPDSTANPLAAGLFADHTNSEKMEFPPEGLRYFMSWNWIKASGLTPLDKGMIMDPGAS